MSKKYYVTMNIGINAGEIHEYLDDNDAYYDFEIVANENELQQLQRLFAEVESLELKGFIIGHNPFEKGGRKRNDDKEDKKIIEIYQNIYQLGTDLTKKKMDETGLNFV